jgi:hypothetical protein
MPLIGRKTDEQKAAETAAAEERARVQAADRAQREEFAKTLPKWEYQVKRVGEDKQKGLLGSQRMEQIFNSEGAKGWELVTINEERATFKRRLPG